MAQFSTDSDLLEFEPDIKTYGIQDFETDPNLHQKSYDDILRLLNIRWAPTYSIGRYDASVLDGTIIKVDPNKLQNSQFTRASVYHVLGYYIYPRLSTFDPAGDAFREKMTYYVNKFNEEFDFILQEGVKYDADSDGNITDCEQQTFYHSRLQR